ncbi:MAG TPA: hypothetical protein VK666_11995, partial [Chryseolinea sp.]|nr:hypothetical protein [Chryseolinea sp.]
MIATRWIAISDAADARRNTSTLNQASGSLSRLSIPTIAAQSAALPNLFFNYDKRGRIVSCDKY